jgi:hypothetical protein
VRASKRLTAVKVSKTSKPGRYSDGEGLYLQVSRTGTKAWLFRFMLNGHSREMGLGSVSIVSLVDARESARQARRMLPQGMDPIAARQETRLKARAADAKAMTFRECAEAYMEAHRAAWKNAKHIWQWKNSLSTVVFPVFGAVGVEAVDTGLVVKVLETIWRT